MNDTVTITEDTKIGECESCGIITDDDINFNFPNPAQCNLCGKELSRASITSKDVEVKSKQLANK